MISQGTAVGKMLMTVSGGALWAGAGIPTGECGVFTAVGGCTISRSRYSSRLLVKDLTERDL